MQQRLDRYKWDWRMQQKLTDATEAARWNSGWQMQCNRGWQMQQKLTDATEADRCNIGWQMQQKLTEQQRLINATEADKCNNLWLVYVNFERPLLAMYWGTVSPRHFTSLEEWTQVLFTKVFLQALTALKFNKWWSLSSKNSYILLWKK